ncbi:MAG: hypothetical protein FWD57_12680 [Polyangiaceae bacterium]|nr:hypothetical protein [Polyangiaceae bacterium]
MEVSDLIAMLFECDRVRRYASAPPPVPEDARHSVHTGGRLRRPLVGGQWRKGAPIRPHSASYNTDPNVHTHAPISACMFAQMLWGQGEVVDGHDVVSVKHWDRNGRGMLYAPTSAMPWVILDARTSDACVLGCGEFSGLPRVRAEMGSLPWR